VSDPLVPLEDRDGFTRRHLGPKAADRERMLDGLGFGSMAELLDATVPPGSVRRARRTSTCPGR
jgi:glycine dehydrogenase